MASGHVKGCISTVLLDKNLESVESRRWVDTKYFGQQVISKVTGGDREIELFDLFCTNLTTKLTELFDSAIKCRTPDTKKTKCLSSFHQLRKECIPKLWNDLFLQLNLAGPQDHFFAQSVTQELFRQMMVDHFTSESQSQPHKETKFTSDELNVMRYACGFVPHKLLLRYEKRPGDKYKNFVACLGDMAVVGENDDLDFLGYTKTWFDKVNRGGLFPLNDETFNLFTAVETIVRIFLPTHARNGDLLSEGLKDLVDRAIEDSDVQFHWTIIVRELELEEAVELLEELVRLWVTVRGFSLAATWMETYKQATKKQVSKSTGLRKHLS